MFFDIDVLDHIDQQFGFFWIHILSLCHPRASNAFGARDLTYGICVTQLLAVFNELLEDWGAHAPRVLSLAPRQRLLWLNKRSISARRRNGHARARALPRPESRLGINFGVFRGVDSLISLFSLYPRSDASFNATPIAKCLRHSDFVIPSSFVIRASSFIDRATCPHTAKDERPV